MSQEVIAKLEEKMEKTISVLKEELNGVRAGRANPAILDKVMVEYYGTPTPIKSLANLSVPEPRILMVTPFDPQAIKDIEKGINVANLGLTPSNDGKCIRLTVPELTEERRKELTKTVKKYGEDSKIAIRNERRNANDEMKKEEKTGDLTEDLLKDAMDEIQDKVDKAVKEIDEIVKAKENEILEV